MRQSVLEASHSTSLWESSRYILEIECLKWTTPELFHYNDLQNSFGLKVTKFQTFKIYDTWRYIIACILHIAKLYFRGPTSVGFVLLLKCLTQSQAI